MKLLSELDSLDNVKDGSIRKLPTKTSDLTNDSGFITSSISVIDNLTSTSTTSALSAKQGKVLNDNKVPNTRTVAGKALSANITLASTDLTDTANIATVSQLATKAVQPYIQRSYSGGNGIRLIGTYNYSTSVGDTRPLFYMAGKQGHGNGTSYLWQGEFIFGVSTTGVVTAKAILKVSNGTFGKFYYRHDTTNKILYLYIYTGQYSSAYFSDLIQINAGNYSSYFTLSPAGSVTTDTIVEGVNILYPASGGTIALTSQIPSSFVDLTTAQTIAGTKTFSDDLKLSKKLYVGAQQTIYNADAEGGFTGSLFFGNGGGALSHPDGMDGYYNTAIGFNSLYNNTTGAVNVAVGHNSLNANTVGFENTGIGSSSLGSNTTGFFNVGVGVGSLFKNINGSGNTGIGHNALMQNIDGNSNVGVGYWSLVSNTSGLANIGIGYHSLGGNKTGSGSIGIGTSAGSKIANGSTTNTTANNSIYIGVDTKALADNQTNQIVIGHNTTGHGSNTATIGNSSITDNYFTGNIHLTGTILGMYPIGAIYISVVSTSPASLFGGTWVAFGAGRVLLGMGSNGETNYTTVGATGGSENSNAIHSHGVNTNGTGGSYWSGNVVGGNHAGRTYTYLGFVESDSVNGSSYKTGGSAGNYIGNSGTTGGNRMPYITVYMWKRTA